MDFEILTMSVDEFEHSVAKLQEELVARSTNKLE